MKFRVVFFNAFTFVNRAPRRTHAKTQIPHRARKFGNQRPKFFFGFFVRKKKQNVQIGKGKQHSPPVSSERKQTQSFLRRVVQFQRVLEHLLQAAIREFAQRQQRRLRARSVFKVLPDARSFVLALCAELR